MSVGLNRDPAMVFRLGEAVRFAIGDEPPGPKTPRELFVIGRKGKEHILTIDEIASIPDGKSTAPAPTPGAAPSPTPR
jgi:hypothetical protein